MSATPLVSIIIPCYNAARYLPETLGSIRNQTLRGYEVIAVNDGSTDATLSILQSSGMNIRIVDGAHAGVSHARQVGTTLAAGRYLQYLDADDLLLPDALALKVAALESTAVDVVYSAYQRLEEATDGSFGAGEVRRPRPEDFDDDMEVAVLAGFWTPLASLLYRRSFVARMPEWQAQVEPIEDARFLLDAAYSGARFLRIDEVGALYRAHQPGNSFSSRSKLRFIQACFRNGVDVQDRWRLQPPSFSGSQRKALIQLYSYVAEEFCRLQEEAGFSQSISRLRALAPRVWTAATSLAVINQTAGLGAARAGLYVIRIVQRVYRFLVR